MAPIRSIPAGERLRAALFDSHTIEQVALDTAPHVQRDGDRLGASMIERARRAIDFHPAGETRFTVTYRAPTAALARRGCESLTNAASERLQAQRPASSLSPQEEARQRARVVEEKTRELAMFVAQHPELAGKKSESGEAFLGVPGMRPPSTPAPAPTVDSVLPILVQQKARLEDRIAFVERVELGGVEESADKAFAERHAGQDGPRILTEDAGAGQSRDCGPPSCSRARARQCAERSASRRDDAGRTPAAHPGAIRMATSGASRRRCAAASCSRRSYGAGAARRPITEHAASADLAEPPTLDAAWRDRWALDRHLVGLLTRGVGARPDGRPRRCSTSRKGSLPFRSRGKLHPRRAEAPSTVPLVAEKAVRCPPAAPVHAAPAAPAEPLALAKTEALPSFPMDAESAKAAAEATSASRLTAAKVATPAPAKAVATPPAPAPAKAAVTPAPPAPPARPVPAAAAPAAALPVPPVAVVEARGALPSFPMDAELAKAVEEATSASRAAPAKPVTEQGLPKVIIAAETAAPAETKRQALPSFPMEPEPPMAAPRAVAAEPAAAAAPEKGLPVLVVDGAQRTSVAPNAPIERAPYAAERSPYAAVTEATRISIAYRRRQTRPRLPAQRPKHGGQVDTRHGTRRHTPRRGPHGRRPAREAKASRRAACGAAASAAGSGKIEASPIMGIEEGLSTAASGKQGISVYPPPVAPVAPAPSGPVPLSPLATMRLGSVSPSERRRGRARFGAPESQGDPSPGDAACDDAVHGSRARMDAAARLRLSSNAAARIGPAARSRVPSRPLRRTRRTSG